MADRRHETGADRSSEQIRRDMDETRSDLHETVNALERKLTIGQLFDEVMDRIDGGGTVGSVADTVGDAIRRNPIPIGLVGAGVAWMAIDRATRSEGEELRREYGDHEPGTERRTEMRRGPYRGDEIGSDGTSRTERTRERIGSMKTRTFEAVDSARASASDAANTTKDRASSVAGSAKDHGVAAADTVRDRASDAADTVKHGARRAKRGFSSALEEQPLALGAVAFGLGLASGLAAPTTRVEDEAMGELSDAVLKETKSVARDAASSARDVAEDAARAAKREADRQDVVGDLKDSARAIGEEAKETARRRAAEEDVDAEGMKRRTAEATSRAREKVGKDGDRG